MGTPQAADRGPARASDERRIGPGPVLAGAVLLVVALATLSPVAGALQTGPTATLTTSPAPAHPGEPVVLDATGSTAGGNDAVAECAFDVDGDGTDDVTTDTCRLETTYDEAGEYEPSVRVVTTADESATNSTTLVVRENRPPEAAISVLPDDPRPGSTVTLSATDATDPDGDVVRHVWTVDGRTLSGETVSYRVGAAGNVSVSLRIFDDDGANATASRTVAVRANRPPLAALDVGPATPTAGESVTLDAGDSRDPDGSIAAYRWDLDGDGTVDRETTTATVSFGVEGPGEREAGVTVVDDAGATNATAAGYTVVAVPTASTTATATRAPDVGNGTGASGGFLDVIDPGFVPVLPDWFVLLVLVAGVGAVAAVRRREALRSRLSDVRERVRTGAFRKRVAKSASGFVVKTVAKKIVRKGADIIEFVTTGLGDAIERLGRAIRHGGQRVAAFLRKLGS